MGYVIFKLQSEQAKNLYRGLAIVKAKERKNDE